ncbi:MAG: DnaB-like helicase C-terminal domain-containing protein [Bacteroidales bacterium]
MKSKDTPALSEAFLLELYYAAFKYQTVCGVLVQYMESEYLPDREFQALQKAITIHYKAHKSTPSYGSMIQKFSHADNVLELIEDIRDSDFSGSVESVLDTFEEYIKDVRLRNVYTEVGKLYNKGDSVKARSLLKEYAEWLSDFSFSSEDFVDVIGTFEERHEENYKAKQAEANSESNIINRFYIDALDNLNAGRNLRGQLSCFVAPAGVGKSHIARHIGKHAAIDDGLNVLHIQLEGSKKEVVDAYSGGLCQKNAYWYESGRMTSIELEHFRKKFQQYTGTIRVKSYPRFNNQVSTVDVKNAIQKYEKSFGYKPDVVIIDSLDLLTESSGKNWDSKDERHRRVKTANDLKDLAGDEDIWIVVTYQATMENRDWLNDEKNVLTEFNCAEAKGLARPVTHMITLNQSDAEREECIMRLFVAKSRFFKKGLTAKIATRFDDEVFYDRQRTLNLLKASA